MESNESKSRRGFKTIRLQNRSYSEARAYFVTIVTYNRVCLFAEIKNDESLLTPIGKIVCEEWERSTTLRKDIELGDFVVMPNHLHGILLLRETAENQSARSAALQEDWVARTSRDRAPNSVSSLIAGYKASVTRKIREHLNDSSFIAWQPRFYDRVIRNQTEYARICSYIQNNPRNWSTDSENL